MAPRTAIVEAEDAAVLKESAENADDANVVAHPRDARPQAAEAADDQVDLHAGAAGVVERLDDRFILQLIHLRRDRCFLATLCRLGFNGDHLQEAVAHVRGRDQQLAVVALNAAACERVKQLDHIAAQRIIAREQADIRIERGSAVVVVARPNVAVSAQSVQLLTHGHCELGVGLETDNAVNDVNAGLFKLLSQFHIAMLVEARLKLNEYGNLFAFLGGADERLDKRAVAARSVECHLDRQHMRIVRRLGDEALHACGETLIRVMHQYRTTADYAENIRILIREPRRQQRLPRLEFQLRPLQIAKRHQIVHVDWAIERVDVFLGHAQATADHLAHAVAHAFGRFKPHDARHATLAKFLLHHRQQIVRILLIGLNVGVASNAKQVVLDDPHPREKQLQITADNAFQADKSRRFGDGVARPIRQRNPPRQVLRQLHPHETCFPRRRMLEHHTQRLAQIADERKRMPRINRQRRENRKHLFAEELVGRTTVARSQLGVPADADPFLLQRRVQFFKPQFHLSRQQGTDRGMNKRELLVGRQAIKRPAAELGQPLPLQPADALHVKLIKVAGKDGEKTHALQQRHATILRQFQHACIEVEPGQFTVKERLVRRRQCNRRRKSRNCVRGSLHRPMHTVAAVAAVGGGGGGGGRGGEWIARAAWSAGIIEHNFLRNLLHCVKSQTKRLTSVHSLHRLVR